MFVLYINNSKSADKKEGSIKFLIRLYHTTLAHGAFVFYFNISESAFKANLISSMVVKYPKLKRRVPSG